MLQDFIENKFIENFEHTPTNDQYTVLKAIANFISSAEEVLIIKGYAGTGKTSLVATLVKTLAEFDMQTCLMAPTGRAAKVLSNYTKAQATTIHKRIYRQQSVQEGGVQKFALNFNKYAKTFFIVDEASMLSNKSLERSAFGTGFLIDDLCSFIFNNKGCKLILIGDEAQLPPIGVIESPALSEEFIQRTYLRETITCSLNEIVRQEKKSGILAEATQIRNLIANNSTNYPRINQYTDVISVPGNELLDKLESSYSNVGSEETIIITRSNKLANKYNEGIRNMILWRESQISIGDYIMIVKNNYFWTEKNQNIEFIANGDIARVTAIHNYENLYECSFANISISLPDYNDEEFDVKVLLNTLQTESPALPYEDSLRFYNTVLEDYAHIPSKAKKYQEMRKNEYFNALQIKFAYAVTCHKAQGGQWKHVYIDHGYLPEETVDQDFLRWLYTAFTRATEKLYLVNFKKNFFE